MNPDIVILTSNKSGKRVSFRKSEISVVYQQGDSVINKKPVKGVVALTRMNGEIYEIKESFKQAMKDIYDIEVEDETEIETEETKPNV